MSYNEPASPCTLATVIRLDMFFERFTREREYPKQVTPFTLAWYSYSFQGIRPVIERGTRVTVWSVPTQAPRSIFPDPATGIDVRAGDFGDVFTITYAPWTGRPGLLFVTYSLHGTVSASGSANIHNQHVGHVQPDAIRPL